MGIEGLGFFAGHGAGFNNLGSVGAGAGLTSEGFRSIRVHNVDPSSRYSPLVWVVLERVVINQAYI